MNSALKENDCFNPFNAEATFGHNRQEHKGFLKTVKVIV